MADSDSKLYGRVYVVTNRVTGKQYVGQTVSTVETRWTAHQKKTSRCSALSGAIAKYGADAFCVEEVASATDKASLDAIEATCIEQFASIAPNGYNLKDGGGSRGTWSKEMRARMALVYKSEESVERNKASSTAMWQVPEIRAKISAAIKVGLSLPEVVAKRSAIAKVSMRTPSAQANIRAGQAKRFSDPNEVKRVSEAARKRMLDPEVKAALIELGVAYRSDPKSIIEMSGGAELLWQDPKHREKMLLAHANRKKSVWSEEAKNAARERMKSVWQSPETREAHRRTQVGRKNTPETIEKMRIAKIASITPEYKAKVRAAALARESKKKDAKRSGNLAEATE